MNLSRERLDAEAAATGFAADVMEEALEIVLPFEAHEREFLDRLLDQGEILPELLTLDEALQERIRNHPDLAWKALNVQSFIGREKP